MKLAATTLAILVALATAESHNFPDFGEGPLHDDLHYFLDMIPVEDISLVILQYVSEDVEVQEALTHLSTDEFKQMVVDIQAIPELVEFLHYLENNGVHMFDLLDKVNSLLGIGSIERSGSKAQITGGLAGLFEDVKKHISYDLFINGYAYKMRTSEAFRGFVAQLKSEGHQKFVDALYSNEHYLAIRGALIAKGVDIQLIENVIYVVLGIQFPVVESYNSNQLEKDFQDIIQLALTDEVKGIIFAYVTEDVEFQNSIAYMYTSEFHQMVRDVEALKEYQELLAYLNKGGLKVYEFLQKVHEVLGMEDYVPPKEKTANGKYQSLTKASKKLTGGVRGFVDDIMAVLPIGAIKDMYEEKLRTSKVFADFIEFLNSPTLQKIVDSFYNHKVFLDILKTANDVGLDLVALRNLLQAMFGLTFPKA